eukprot:scaffold446657_cov17-Prasinocladus_malaysianus.AAC.1
MWTWLRYATPTYHRSMQFSGVCCDEEFLGDAQSVALINQKIPKFIMGLGANGPITNPDSPQNAP